jgi:hypothetical protein
MLQKALKLQILKALKNPIISRKKRAKKAKIVENISAVQEVINLQTPRVPPPNSRFEATKTAGHSLSPAAVSTDDENGSQGESGENSSHKNSKKKRKAGRTRLNKFKVQNCGDGNEGAGQTKAPSAHAIPARISPVPSGESDQTLEPQNSQNHDAASEGARAKKMTRAEKADAASKVKESLPRYLRINTLLGMTFREVQKALLASGCVSHSNARPSVPMPHTSAPAAPAARPRARPQAHTAARIAAAAVPEQDDGAARVPARRARPRPPVPSYCHVVMLP